VKFRYKSGSFRISQTERSPRESADVETEKEDRERKELSFLPFDLARLDFGARRALISFRFIWTEPSLPAASGIARDRRDPHHLDIRTHPPWTARGIRRYCTDRVSSVRPAKPAVTIAACSARLVLMVGEAPRSPEECSDRFLFLDKRSDRSLFLSGERRERTRAKRAMMYRVSRSLSRAFARTRHRPTSRTFTVTIFGIHAERTKGNHLLVIPSRKGRSRFPAFVCDIAVSVDAKLTFLGSRPRGRLRSNFVGVNGRKKEKAMTTIAFALSISGQSVKRPLYHTLACHISLRVRSRACGILLSPRFPSSDSSSAYRNYFTQHPATRQMPDIRVQNKHRDTPRYALAGDYPRLSLLPFSRDRAIIRSIFRPSIISRCPAERRQSLII